MIDKMIIVCVLILLAIFALYIVITILESDRKEKKHFQKMEDFNESMEKR